MDTSTSTDETVTDDAPLADPQRIIDDAIAAAHDDTSLDHRELATALLAARDIILLYGRVPEWFGDADAPQYEDLTDDVEA